MIVVGRVINAMYRARRRLQPRERQSGARPSDLLQLRLAPTSTLTLLILVVLSAAKDSPNDQTRAASLA
jgi:hypothetical protein